MSAFSVVIIREMALTLVAVKPSLKPFPIFAEAFTLWPTSMRTGLRWSPAGMKSSKAPVKAALMRQILHAIEDADPNQVRLNEGMSVQFGSSNAFKNDEGTKMRETPEDEEVKDRVFSAASDEIRQLVERYERLEAEKKRTSPTPKKR